MQIKYSTGLNISLIIISLIFFVISCEDHYYEDISNITNNQGVNAEIVINGGITSEMKYHEITLTKPILLYGHKIDSISGAIVSLKIGDNYYEFVEEVNHPNITTQKKRKGTYVSLDRIKGTPGAIHTLIVNYADKTYTASDIMLEVVPFDFTYMELPYLVPGGEYDSLGNLIGPTYELKLFNFGTEKTNISNWYLRDTIFEIEDRYDATQYFFSTVDQQGLLSEMYWELCDRMGVRASQKVTLEKLSISQQYEEYLIAVLKETFWNSNLFSTVPANVPTNVSEGGFGYFYASDAYTQTITATEFRKLVDLNE
ncbi:MAG: hypothetical protein PHE33_09680 [Bacteroidales bacterium]|nr:hypothetical protein [Bacteroidales bacterium]